MKSMMHTCTAQMKDVWQQLTHSGSVTDQYLDYINEPPEERGNRLCVCVSDIHLTDGTVGFQNLGGFAWTNFYHSIVQRCNSYKITELLIVLDGDIIDMIRSGQWADAGVYPWERERKEEFSAVVNKIIREIIDHQHDDFFKMLRELPENIVHDTAVAKIDDVKIILTIGNHDKELFCDQQALSYFYTEGLGKPLEDITLAERQKLGRMYGDQAMFDDMQKAPYWPFYYGDTGFRFFTTHGQWRDQDNSQKVLAKGELPGWSVSDGWCIDKWKQLRFSPFFLPCFGDTVAAGVLSTFIHKVKIDLETAGYNNKRLLSILDELDLYRPTYKALTRVLDEADRMRRENKQLEKSRSENNPQLEATLKQQKGAIKIIEDTLFQCVIEWLNWDFTYQSAPILTSLGLKAAKWLLEIKQILNRRVKIKAIYWLLWSFDHIIRFNQKGVRLGEMCKFPAFLPAYRHYGFQVYGEGHTHIPLQEEPDFSCKHPSSYINFGTWRDQIIARKNDGYRRRGVLRALYIMDLINESETVPEPDRAFDYMVEDIVLWSDFKDAMDESGKAESKT